MTQTDLAVALGERYSQSMISQVERGRSSLLLDGLVAAANELNVSADYLLGLSDDPKPSSFSLPVLGPRLTEARERTGMTMGELAAVLDDEYDESVVSQVEASTLSLSLDGLVHAARILSVSADYLLGLTAVPNAPVHLAPELADIVIIPGDRNYIGWDGDVEFVEVGLPFSATFLSFHGIDPARARAFRVAHSSVPGFIPHGAHIVVDYAGTELNEKNIYLASRHRSLELGRFRLDAAPYFWNSRRRETGRWRRNARGFNVVGMVCWSSTFFDRGETFIPDPDECEGDITMWERR